MSFREHTRMVGGVRFRVYDHVLRLVVRDERIENLIVTAWLNRMRDAHMTTTDLTIRYLAWGDDNTAPAIGNTTLGNELGRKETTQKVASGTAEITTTTYLAPGEANVQLEEWGLFGGTTGALVLVSRVLWSHLKTASESIQVDWTHTFAEIP